MQQPKITQESSATLEITDLGTVTSETMGIATKSLNYAVPITTTKGNRFTNTFGKVRTIQIQGIHTGEGYGSSTVTTRIRDFVLDVENWINAVNDTTNNAVQVRKQYTSTLGNVYKVFCSSFIYTWSEIGPEHITYTMSLTEGGNMFGDAIEDILGQ